MSSPVHTARVAPCSVSLPHAPELNGIAQVMATGIALLAGIVAMLLVQPHALARDQASDPDDVTERIAVPVTPEAFTDRAAARRLILGIDRAALRACGDEGAETASIRNAVERSACHRQGFDKAVQSLEHRHPSSVLADVAARYERESFVWPR